MKFRIGDTVRALGDTGSYRKGDICTVSDVSATYIYLNGSRREDANGLHPNRFELVPPVMTPKELADEYRRLREEAIEVYAKLSEHGYTGYWGEYKMINILTVKDISFKKTVTTTEVL